MRACSECGHLTDDDANFCDQCGNRMREEKPPPVIPDEPEQPDRPLESRPWVWVVGAVALLVAIGAAAALVFNDPESEPESEPSATAAPTDPTTPAVVPTPDPDEVLGAGGTTRVRLSVSNCAGCEVTAVPADETESQVATVASNAVEFALPAPSTLGLGFTVVHPDGFGRTDGPSAVVLAPAGVVAGSPVTVSDLLDADAVSLCWAGTVKAEQTIPLTVEIYDDGTRQGGLRVWADPAEPATDATPAATQGGSVPASALASCAPVDDDA